MKGRRKMKKKIFLLAVVLLVIIAQMGFVNAADGAQGEFVYDNVAITTKVTTGTGTTLPTQSITYTFTQVTTDASVDALATTAHAISPITIALNTLSSPTNSNNSDEYTYLSTLTINPATFPHAGVYEYDVRCTTADSNGLDVNIGNDEYVLKIYIKNGVSALELGGITVADATQKVNAASGAANDFIFEHKYVKSAPVTITNQIEGLYANKTEDFTYNIEITVPSVADPTTIANQIKELQDVDASKVTIDNGVIKITGITLGDDDTLSLGDIPVGASVKVVDSGKNLYTPSYTYNSGNSSSGTKSQPLTVTQPVVDTTGANFVFTNTFDDTTTTPITGLILSNLPYILLVTISLFGIIILVIADKKRKEKLNNN